MINKIIEALSLKLPIKEVINSQSTDSKYIKFQIIDSIKSVRVSDHFGHAKDNIDINIIVPRTPKYFIIVCGYDTYIETSFRKTIDFVISYFRIEHGVAQKESSRISNQSEVINSLKTKVSELNEENEKLSKLNNQLQTLNKNLANSGKESEYKKKLDRQTSELKRMNEKQAEYKKDIENKDAAIKEAAELIESLTTNPELRQMIVNENTGKKYYLDNFTEDAQDMLQELIKNYYSK